MTVERSTNTACAAPDIIDGATIDGAAITSGTLEKLEASVTSGATLKLPPGTFIGTAGIFVVSTLAGAGMGKTIIDATGFVPYNNFGVLVPQAPGIMISNVSIRGASISDELGGNAAGVRDSGKGIGFKLSNVEISGCQNGILTFGSDIEIVGGYIHDNGSGSGQTHNLYVNGNGSNFFRLTNFRTAGCNGGHEVKSRAAHTISFGCHHITGGNGAAYDVPDGGQLSISSGSMTIPSGAADHKFLSYAAESTKNKGVGNIVTITDEVFNDGTGSGGVVVSGDPTATLVLSGCTFTGSLPPQIRGWGEVNGSITKLV